MTAWSAPDFLDGLKAQLDIRAGLTSLTPAVRVVTYWPSADESITDAIILYGAEDDTDQTIMNPATKPRDENVNIEGEIRVVRAGSGQTVAEAARDRAQTILNEVDAQLRENPPALVLARKAGIVSRRLDQFPSESGATPVRVCLLSFTIRYLARTVTA